MTTYKVLYLEPDAVKYELLQHTYDAASAMSAAKAAALATENEGEYVAIPARSWDPITVAIETNPRVKVVKQMAGERFIWTKRAINRWIDGKPTPSHTISAPNIAEMYDGYVRQLKKDTPWMLVDGDNQILATGTAGFADSVLI